MGADRFVVEAQLAPGGDWKEATTEAINATALLVLGLEVGFGRLYRFRLRGQNRLGIGPAGESTDLRFADGSSPHAAPRVRATSSASVLVSWSRGQSCDEGSLWTVQVRKRPSGAWLTLDARVEGGAFVAHPLTCRPIVCSFRVRLSTTSEAVGYSEESEQVLTPALPSVPPNAVRALLTLRAEARVAQNADQRSWQQRLAHALEQQLLVHRVSIVEVRRVLGPERWVVLDLIGDSKPDALRLSMHLVAALKAGTLEGAAAEVNGTAAVFRILEDGMQQVLDVQSVAEVDALPLDGSGSTQGSADAYGDLIDALPMDGDDLEEAEAYLEAALVETAQAHAGTVVLVVALAAVLLACICAAGVCYYRRMQRRTQLWAGELASRMAARRRARGRHSRLRAEDGEVPSAAADEELLGVTHAEPLVSDEDECDVLVTSMPGVRPTCVTVKAGVLRQHATATLLKDALVRIAFQACRMPFAADDAARVEYVTAAGERMQLTHASHAPWVTARAVEYCVVLSAAAAHQHVEGLGGLRSALVNF